MKSVKHRVAGCLALGFVAAFPAAALAQPTQSAPDERREKPAKPSLPPQSLVGRDIVNAQGQPIGKVKAVVGTQVIVSIAEAGASHRDIALPWEKITVVGAGDQLRLQTDLTSEQLKALMQERRADALRLPL